MVRFHKLYTSTEALSANTRFGAKTQFWEIASKVLGLHYIVTNSRKELQVKLS